MEHAKLAPAAVVRMRLERRRSVFLGFTRALAHEIVVLAAIVLATH